ncbi:tetratricopeptide repeat protein [Myxococcus sp. AM009]|uniref:tetratricopeptide repeat protein n=1 Tax=unclassified Myxococcus TaxID=2648731 RepID=UPI0015958269|nr:MULTISPECIES: tetratricopeptide repeat protein [unclassified Myxococcus]NVI97324.1 tetratricopeptide repeat protein [Myxococcus sp. AM009]NVJ12956.1 tetratricopeptide repeat protein [Myxococcus sp. AM010]
MVVLRRFVIALSAALLLGAAEPSAAARAAFLRGESALARGRWDDAAAAYREALSDTPGYPAALNGLGSVLFRKGQVREALTHFRDATQADPGFKMAWFNLGYAARKTGDAATAARAYERYTELEPGDADGFYGLGESYRQLGQKEKAIPAYQAYIAREQRKGEQVWVRKATEHLKAMGAEPLPVTTAPPSLAPAAEASTSNPALAASRIRDGDALMKERRYREAAFAFLDASHADASHVEALFKLGNALAVLGYYGQAVAQWERATALTTDAAIQQSAKENIDRARAKLAQAGASPQAAGQAPGSGPVADTTRALARRAYEQGVQRIGAKDFSGALTSLTQAIQHEPMLAVAFVARGSANIGLRRYAEAAADYQYALELEPGSASPLYGLAESFRAMGRTLEARDLYERYAASSAEDVRPQLQEESRQKAARLR